MHLGAELNVGFEIFHGNVLGVGNEGLCMLAPTVYPACYIRL